MPQRQNVKRIESGPVQGDDSFVTLRRPTMRQAQEIGEKWTQWGDSERVGALAPMVEEWNWVDDAGAPLPQAREQPEIILDLTDLELRFIVGALVNPDTKN